MRAQKNGLMKARETNLEFLQRVGDFARCGPVMQLFMMDSLQKMAERVAETPIAELRESFGPNAFISADAWQRAAIELREEFAKFFSEER